MTTALVEELLRSATNKGCTIVEVTPPSDPAARSTWARLGFSEGGPVIERAVGAVGNVARRSV